jgi:aryl-alcohol dehydrogenase-like predicted oxidoreductase
VERDKAKACVDKAFDLGINFIDTANVYGRGAAESVLGDLLAGRPRDSYVLATKVFGAMSDTDQGLSRGQIRKQIDASLQRLRVDHVDLYQCHRYDTATPLEETMEALTEVVKAGKARWIGFSEWSPANIEAAFALKGVERLVSSQPQYSLLWRRPEAKVIPLCAANGVSQIVWSPLAQGVLSGKYQPGAELPAQSRATSDQMSGAMQNWLRPDILERVQELKPIAAKAGCSLTQFSLAWVLREPNVASAIVGASRPEQLEENAGASGFAIDPALFREAEDLVAGLERAR